MSNITLLPISARRGWMRQIGERARSYSNPNQAKAFLHDTGKGYLRQLRNCDVPRALYQAEDQALYHAIASFFSSEKQLKRA